MDFQRHLLGFAQGPQIARQLAKGCTAITGLDGHNGGAQGGAIANHLRQCLHLTRERDHLSPITGLEVAQHLECLVLGAGQAIAVAHAEGTVDSNYRQLLTVRGSRGAANERAGE